MHCQNVGPGPKITISVEGVSLQVNASTALAAPAAPDLTDLT